MLFWISFLLVVLSGAVLAFVLLRHWREIRLLDPDTIRAEQERKARDRIMKERFDRQLKRWMAPVRHAGKGVARTLGESISNMEKRLRQVSGIERGDHESPLVGRVTQLVREAQALSKEGKIGRAERAYLEALKIDMRNIEAYRGLGLLYLSDRQYRQAKETFDFLVHFNSADGTVYAGLATIAEADSNFEDAEKYLKLAISSEPTALRHTELGEYYLRREQGTLALEQARLARMQDSESPRHLELLADSAIMLRDRKEAELAYQTLRIKGCDRSTLQRLKEQLDALEDEEDEKG